MPAPAAPKIYHIVHVDNLASVVADGRLWSDKAMTGRQVPVVVGMGNIKQRRMALPVSCHPGTYVGEYVPFYFCSRSVMLYVIHRANNPELAYRGGQEPIVHLEADLRETVRWAEMSRVRWAFSLSNAGARYTRFRSSLEHLDEVDWEAVAAIDFRDADVKEGKQAEFLVEHAFPWELVRRVGVFSQRVARRTADAMREAPNRPQIEILPNWYY